MIVYLYVMDRRLKKGLITGLAVLSVLIIGSLVLNTVIENKLKARLAHISKTIKIQYQDINVNVLTGCVMIIQPKLWVYGKTTQEMIAQIELNELSINDISYWNYLFKDKIAIKNISFDKPKAIYHHNKLVNLESSQKSYTNALDNDVEIGAIEIINGDVGIFSVDKDSLMVKAKDVNFKINAVGINKSSLKQKIPFTFGSYKLTYNDMFYVMNDFENLSMNAADFNTDFYKIQNLAIKTKYSPVDLSNQIAVERDHFNLTVDTILVKSHGFGFKNDSTFYFKSSEVDLYQPNFKVYRDKLVEDDLSYKPLYSKALRHLNFDLLLEQVDLYQASIVYTEKVREDTNGGRLEFSNLTAAISNLGNTAEESETSIHIEGIFMENTPIKVDWNFNVKDTNDEFVFKADIGNLAASHMNQFMEPNLNVKLNGEVEQTYFTINGNDHTSRIDLEMKYDNFNIAILRQDGKKKNKFLSAIANLFVSSDSKDKVNDYRHGNAKDVERDKTKSVFNYLWLNIKATLLNAMTGDGEKS